MLLTLLLVFVFTRLPIRLFSLILKELEDPLHNLFGVVRAFHCRHCLEAVVNLVHERVAKFLLKTISEGLRIIGKAVVAHEFRPCAAEVEPKARRKRLLLRLCRQRGQEGLVQIK